MSDAAERTAVPLLPLRDWMSRVFVQQGMFAAEADIAVQRLLEAELLGRPAGGLRWFPRLVSAMDLGDIDPRAQFVKVAELPALTVIDGSTGVGQVTLTHALHQAAGQARTVGSAAVIIRNSRPVGDPTSCLIAATQAGCIAGIITTCKRQTEPWPIGPSTVWGWPGTDSPLLISADPPTGQADLLADALAVGCAGKKPSPSKKRLFGDDAEHLCLVIDPAHGRSLSDVSAVTQAALGTKAFPVPGWIFDRRQWPATAEFAADIVAEFRELAATARIPAEW